MQRKICKYHIKAALFGCINFIIVFIWYQQVFADSMQEREAILTANGDLYIKSEYKNSSWDFQKSKIKEFQIDANRIAVLDKDGNLYLQEGSIKSKWNKQRKNIKDFLIDGSRIEVIDKSGKMYYKEGSLTAKWIYYEESIDLFNAEKNKKMLTDSKPAINLNDNFMKNNIGLLSSIFESNSDPGTISNGNGDYGDKSYGAWQISSKMGSMDNFFIWLKGKDINIYNELILAFKKDNSSFGQEFDLVWTRIAKQDKNKFYQLQWNYIKENYYDPVVNYFNNNYNFDITQKTFALKNVVWSTTVQHGPQGAIGIIKKCLNNLKTNNIKDDESLIKAIYNERKKVCVYFKNSSSKVQKSVLNRINNEHIKAIEMLRNN